MLAFIACMLELKLEVSIDFKTRVLSRDIAEKWGNRKIWKKLFGKTKVKNDREKWSHHREKCHMEAEKRKRKHVTEKIAKNIEERLSEASKIKWKWKVIKGIQYFRNECSWKRESKKWNRKEMQRFNSGNHSQ